MQGAVIKKLAIAICVMAVLFVVVRYVFLPEPEAAPAGYAKADTLYVAATQAGEVDQMLVKKGQRLDKAAPLFTMNLIDITARIEQTEATMSQHTAKIEHETAILAQLHENLAVTETEVERTQDDLTRFLRIVSRNPGAISQIDVDHARIAAISATLQRSAAAKEIEAALANISSAEQQLRSAKAELVRLQRQKVELAPISPVSGYVEDIYVQQGEWAVAGTPVLGIVPDDNILIRFYVPEQDLALYALGTPVEASTSSGNQTFAATVVYVAPKPEYTPPVIYSLESRHKMMFCIEARPQNPQGIVVGMPLDITLPAR